MPSSPSHPTFASSHLIVHKAVKVKKPVFVAGLPGIGFVSKLAVDHLVKTLGAEKIATLYSPYFPNQVLALKSGRLRLFSMRLFHKRVKSTDFIFLKGDLQPLTVEGQYEVCAKLLEHFASLGGTQVISMAGYAVNGAVDKPAVYATSSSRAQFERLLKLGAKRCDKVVPIVGMAGLLPGLAKLYDLEGACLLVETPGTFIDAKGAVALVSLLGKIAGEKFDVSHLDVRAKKTEALLKRFGEQAARAEEGKGIEAPVEDIMKRTESLTYIR